MSDCSAACANPCASCPLAPAGLEGIGAAPETDALDATALLREAVNACVRQSARDAATQLGLGPEAIDVAVAPDLEAPQPAFVYRITVPLTDADARWSAFDAMVRRHRLMAQEASCLVTLRGGLASRV